MVAHNQPVVSVLLLLLGLGEKGDMNSGCTCKCAVGKLQGFCSALMSFLYVPLAPVSYITSIKKHSGVVIEIP